MGLIAPRSLAAPVAPRRFAVLPVTPRCGPVYARSIPLSRPNGGGVAAGVGLRKGSPSRQPDQATAGDRSAEMSKACYWCSDGERRGKLSWRGAHL